jgi:hypothetical protein
MDDNPFEEEVEELQIHGITNNEEVAELKMEQKESSPHILPNIHRSLKFDYSPHLVLPSIPKPSDNVTNPLEIMASTAQNSFSSQGFPSIPEPQQSKPFSSNSLSLNASLPIKQYTPFFPASNLPPTVGNFNFGQNTINLSEKKQADIIGQQSKETGNKFLLASFHNGLSETKTITQPEQLETQLVPRLQDKLPPKPKRKQAIQKDQKEQSLTLEKEDIRVIHHSTKTIPTTVWERFDYLASIFHSIKTSRQLNHDISYARIATAGCDKLSNTNIRNMYQHLMKNDLEKRYQEIIDDAEEICNMITSLKMKTDGLLIPFPVPIAFIQQDEQSKHTKKCKWSWSFISCQIKSCFQFLFIVWLFCLTYTVIYFAVYEKFPRIK